MPDKLSGHVAARVECGIIQVARFALEERSVPSAVGGQTKWEEPP